MKITDERKTNNKILFSELSFGDVFEHDDKRYMRIYEINGNYIDANAINVSDGDTKYFNSEDLVAPLDAELIIRG